MNLFYEKYPDSIEVCGKTIPIITDFREYVKLLDMLKDESLSTSDKALYLRQYFLVDPPDLSEALASLTDFITMKTEGSDTEQEENNSDDRKDVYSFEYDYPFIFSAFLSEYGINIKTVRYMHWWEFRNLFNGLSEQTEIKQRIMYRSIDLNTIKDKAERTRIQKIQNAIRLPQDKMSDYDIGNAFGW